MATYTLTAQPLATSQADIGKTTLGIRFHADAYTTGNKAANAFPGFTSAASTIFTHTDGLKYVKLQGDANANLFTSNISARDVEVTAGFRLGCRSGIALRFSDTGEGYLFENYSDSYNQVPNHMIKVWYCRDVLTSNIEASGWRATMYNQMNAQNLPGWSDMTGNSTFTFGVSSGWIYLKINGVEVWRNQQWADMQVAKVAVWSNGGVRQVTVDVIEQLPCYSTPSTTPPFYDGRDFGMRYVAPVTGSMSAGSNQLTLAQNVGFKVNDPIIVEIGGEAGGGHFGTRGVGGQWPYLEYANFATMSADLSKANGTYAVALDTGRAYRYLSASTTWATDTAGFQHPMEFQWCQPLSLVTKVTAVSGDGLTLTLAANAVVSTSGANVYLDCVQAFAPIWGDGFYLGTAGWFDPPDNTKMYAPAGTWAVSKPISCFWYQYGITGVEIYGAGKGEGGTTLFTPKGCYGFCISLYQVHSPHVHDLNLVSNNGMIASERYASQGYTGIYGYEPDGYAITKDMSGWDKGDGTNLVQPSMLDLQQSTGALVEDIDFTNGHALIVNAVQNCTMRRLTYHNEVMALSYHQWCFFGGSASGIVWEDCVIDSPTWMVKGFEGFATNGSRFSRCGGTNCSFSNNSATNNFWEDCWSDISANSMAPWFGAGEPVMSFNSNAFGSGYGGTCNNFKCIQHGYVYQTKTFAFIHVQPIIGGVTISGSYPKYPPDGPELPIEQHYGGYCQAPNFSGDGAYNYGPAILTHAANTTIRGMRVVGAQNPGNGNIGIWADVPASGKAQVYDNVADNIKVVEAGDAVLAGNMTNAQYAAYQDVTLSDAVLDNGLGELQDVNQMLLCPGPPADYASAVAAALATGSASFGAPQAGSGLRVSTSPAVDGSVAKTGTAEFWVAVDSVGQRVLAHGRLAGSESLLNGDPFHLDSITINVPTVLQA